MTDGDTVRLASGSACRIAGIDAAKTDPRQARCRAETLIGVRQKADATKLLAGASVTFRRVGRSYKRTVATVRLDGRDVAALLVEKRLAAWWPRGRARPDWCRIRR